MCGHLPAARPRAGGKPEICLLYTSLSLIHIWGALEALASAVPAAGAVHVVNNNAAALVLAATVLAAGREIVISRGEMIEIGDGFRLPDLLEDVYKRQR